MTRRNDIPDDGDRVAVYYNLHKHCLSVQKDRRVVAHVDHAVIEDAEFYVSEAGRQRVLESKQKNVHAKIRGTWRDADSVDVGDCSRAVRYNPYLFSTFVYADTEEPIHNAPLVVVDGGRVMVTQF